MTSIYELNSDDEGVGEEAMEYNDNEKSPQTPVGGLRSFLEKNKAESYETLGTRIAGVNKGSSTAFKIWLSKLEQVYISSQGHQNEENDKEIIRLKSEISDCEKNRKHCEDTIERLKEQTKELIEKINDAKSRQKEKVSIWIGILILIALTFYLFLFYSSAVYSAIFRVIEPGTAIFTTIFFPKALTVSFQDDVFEGLLVVFSPFIFIGLGFLIHKFSEKKKVIDYLKMVLILIVTFIFDAIIAYEITEKIYTANNIIKAVPGPEYSLVLSFKEINFWLIIFAGFVVYIVWGLIISFVLNEINPHNEIKREVEKLNEQKNQINDSVLTYNKVITECNSKIAKFKEQILSRENIVLYSPNGLKSILSSFSSGYITFLKVGRHPNVRECENFLNDKFSIIDSKNQ